jgi:hypothetical protein
MMPYMYIGSCLCRYGGAGPGDRRGSPRHEGGNKRSSSLVRDLIRDLATMLRSLALFILAVAVNAQVINPISPARSHVVRPQAPGIVLFSSNRVSLVLRPLAQRMQIARRVATPSASLSLSTMR